MKFVCRKCETFMNFDEAEGVHQDSLGISFTCPQCKARIAMVTNAGETQMVRALGVQLGGRQAPAAPLELTRATLNRTTVAAPMQSTPSGSESSPLSLEKQLAAGMGKCPFANKLAEMGMPAAKTETAQNVAEVAWSAEAKERLEKVPDFVRPFAKTMIEELARQNGSAVVDAGLMDTAKAKFM